MTDLTGRVVLVTGASKGIGSATAEALVAAGAHVVAHYRSDRAGAERATAQAPADRRLLVPADLSSPDAARGLWAEAVRWQGHIDVLVNNAAVLVESPLDDADADWDRIWADTWATNVAGLMAVTREAVRHFVGRGSGVVVTMSSWAAQRGSGNPHLTAYTASKAAVKAATQTLARAHAADGVLGYVVAPGMVRTQMSEIASASTGGEAVAAAGLAMGEWVPPSEIADLITFLASGTRRHLSGATFDVNGASYIR